MSFDNNIEQGIQPKGETPPRVTPQDIEDNILSVFYFTAAQGADGAAGIGHWNIVQGCIGYDYLRPVTFCVITLRNGFAVTGESACISPENFDAELGKKIARENAVKKIWPLMGYALKQKLYEAQNPMPVAAFDPYNTINS